MGDSVQQNSYPEEAVLVAGGKFTGPVAASTAPSPTPTPSGGTQSLKPKRKMGPIIATIFGIMLLVAGIGAALVAVNQNQIFQQKAANPSSCSGDLLTPYCSSTHLGDYSTNPCSGRTVANCTSDPSGNNDCTVATNRTVNGCLNLPQSQCTAPGSGCTWSSNGQATCGGQNQACCEGSSRVALGYECTTGLSCQNNTCQQIPGGGGGGGGGTGGGTGTATGCSGGCCNVSSSDAARGLYVKKCTCSGTALDGHTGCNDSCTNAGNSACISQPSCGSAQLDISTSGGDVSTNNTQILFSAQVACTTGTPPPSGGSCSGQCIGPVWNGVTMNNCGTIGYDNASGSCSSGAFCCQQKQALPSAPTQGAVVYCQDSGTAYPMPGISVVMTQNQNANPGSFHLITGANGKVLFNQLSNNKDYGAHIGIPGQSDNAFVPLYSSAGKPVANPFAAYPAYANLKLPTGQTYANLTVEPNDHNTLLSWNSPRWYWYCSTGCGRTQGLFLDPNFGLSYAFDIPTYASGEYNIIYRFSNCGTTTTTTPICSTVQTYDTNWNLLTQAQLANLQPGTQVFFTVAGAGGTFDMARFTINSVLQANTTSKNPNVNTEFSQSYTIPAGVTSFTVTAQLHNTADNQWY